MAAETQHANDTRDRPRGGGSRDGAEISKFAAMAAEWWDDSGPMAPLHALNPVRLGYLRDHVCAHFGRAPRDLNPLAGLTVLDAGCGAGLLSEPLARMGAAVTGIDATAETIRVARAHAEDAGLEIDYRVAAVEDLRAEGRTFDLVVSMEVVEHVADAPAFLADCARLTRPGGALVLSTLNRTRKSYALAIVGAEYLLGLVPRGTHQWRKFVRPSEMRRGLADGGATLTDVRGMVPSAGFDKWHLAPRDVDVNYLAFAIKPAV